jgi:hypothetical protein
LSAKSAELLKKEVDVPLPGGATRFDYRSLDEGAGRLYFSDEIGLHVDHIKQPACLF